MPLRHSFAHSGHLFPHQMFPKPQTASRTSKVLRRELPTAKPDLSGIWEFRGRAGGQGVGGTFNGNRGSNTNAPLRLHSQPAGLLWERLSISERDSKMVCRIRHGRRRSTGNANRLTPWTILMRTACRLV